MPIYDISGKMISRATPNQAKILTQIAFAAKRHWGYHERWIQIWSPILTISKELIKKYPTYFASVERKPVGFYAISIEKEKASLEHFWVLPEFMGQGIGKALFKHAIECCKESGAQTLEIESDPHAQGFYEHLGAIKTGEMIGKIEGQSRILPVLKINLT